jgi:hypothetical protein
MAAAPGTRQSCGRLPLADGDGRGRHDAGCGHGSQWRSGAPVASRRANCSHMCQLWSPALVAVTGARCGHGRQLQLGRLLCVTGASRSQGRQLQARAPFPPCIEMNLAFATVRQPGHKNSTPPSPHWNKQIYPGARRATPERDNHPTETAACPYDQPLLAHSLCSAPAC